MSSHLRQRRNTAAAQAGTRATEDAARPPAVQRRGLRGWLRVVLAAAVWLAIGGQYADSTVWGGIQSSWICGAALVGWVSSWVVDVEWSTVHDTIIIHCLCRRGTDT